VTGSEDNKLRLWPLDFTDFLLEAQHEGVVSNIRIASDGRKLAIGTTAGTLGVLNVSEHSYSTVLRSHAASVTQVVPCIHGPQTGTGNFARPDCFLSFVCFNCFSFMFFFYVSSTIND
jgi:WD40 repeat protein